MCGFPLTQQAGQPPATASPFVPPPGAPASPLSPPPTPQTASYPPAEAPRQFSPPSVLQALRVGSPARGQFWFGLALLLIVLVCCPCSLGVLVFGSDAVANPSGFVAQILLIGGCLFLVGLISGIVLMVIGRPRRIQ
ncbi:MAG: hypothetical protein QOH93_2356 [Chloroflexia bacterium]|jgi:hypothetical protein|nr:hypothetical protein [Chloroflexia bacterium]